MVSQEVFRKMPESWTQAVVMGCGERSSADCRNLDWVIRRGSEK